MGDDNDHIERLDRETSLSYLDMMTFLKDEHKEVRVLDHKYVIRGTTGGRVRGLSSDIYKAMRQYLDHSLAPGLLVQHVEQAKAKIQKTKSEPPKNKTTMMTLTDDGFLDSDPTGPVEFSQAELEPVEERCRKYWLSSEHSQQYRSLRAQLMHQYPYLSAKEFDLAFLSSTRPDGVIEKLRQFIPRHHHHHGGHLNVINHVDSDPDDDPEVDEEDFTPEIKEEDIAILRGMLPSMTDVELRQALIQANGNVELAADALFRN